MEIKQGNEPNTVALESRRSISERCSVLDVNAIACCELYPSLESRPAALTPGQLFNHCSIGTMPFNIGDLYLRALGNWLAPH